MPCMCGAVDCPACSGPFWPGQDQEPDDELSLEEDGEEEPEGGPDEIV